MISWLKGCALAAAVAIAPAAAHAQQVVSEKTWSTYDLGDPAGASAMAVDDAGNVYLASGVATGIALTKTTAAGAASWRADYLAPAGYRLNFSSVGVTSDGIPWLAVFLYQDDPALPNVGALIRRYDPATGAQLTETAFMPAAYRWLVGVSTAAGLDGDIFLGGEAANGSSDDLVVARIDRNGLLAWQGYVNNAQYDWSPRLAVDRAGNPVIIGAAWRFNYVSSAGIWTMDPRLTVARFDAATGALLFNTVYEGIPGRDRMGTQGVNLAFDADNNVYVAGAMNTPASGQNLLESWPYLVKFDGAGTLLWEYIDQTRLFGSFGFQMATDPSGALFVAEPFDSSASGRGLDCAVSRFEPSGARAWLVKVDGQESGDDTGCLLAADKRGGLYLAATSTFAGRSPDATVLRIDRATGAALWRAASGNGALARPAVSPALLQANAAGTVAVYAPTAAGDLGVLSFDPAPAAAPLVRPTATVRSARAGTTGSRNVTVSLTSSSPFVSCNVTGGGETFNRLNVAAGASGAFLYRPQVTTTGYDATCFYEGPAGGPAVTATLSFRLEQGQNTVRVPVTFDATTTHQAVSNVIDAQLAQLRYTTTSRVWVFDGLGSRDPDSGLLTYRWTIGEPNRAPIASLTGKGITFRFPSNRAYNVTLTVTDDDGRTGTSTVRVNP